MERPCARSSVGEEGTDIDWAVQKPAEGSSLRAESWASKPASQPAPLQLVMPGGGSRRRRRSSSSSSNSSSDRGTGGIKGNGALSPSPSRPPSSSPYPGKIPRAAEPTGPMHPSPPTHLHTHTHTPTTHTPHTHTRAHTAERKYPDVPDWLATHRPPSTIFHGIQTSRRPKIAVDVSLREPLTRRAPTRQQPQPGVPQPSTPRQSR